MSAPTAKVEAGFGSTWTTADASITWTDITNDVMFADKIVSSRGRTGVLDQFRTTDGQLALANATRTYDGNYSSGSHFGQLVPGVPIRVTTTPAAQSSRAVARGFVTGWPQRYHLANKVAFVPVQFYGIFDKLARARLPQSAVDVEVLADSPVAYWKLDDNTEAEMLDSSGNDQHGVYDNPTLRQDALVQDGGNAVQFDHVGDHRGKLNNALLSAYPFTVEAWVQFSRDLTQTHVIASWQNDTSITQYVTLQCRHNGDANNPNGCAEIQNLGRRDRGGTTIDDGSVHHVAAVVTNATTVTIYVDGVANTMTNVAAGSTSTLSTLKWWTVGNLLNVKAGDFGLGGVEDNVAVYPSALSAARVLAHYNSGTAPWDGDTTDARLGRILGVVGIPADRRNFQTCTTLLGQTVLGQQLALDYMRKVEASEDGKLFETADGKIRFLDRYWGITDTHGTTSQQTFSDLSGVSYSTLEVDPLDELLVNVAKVTRENAAALTIENSTSVNTYGYADTSVDVLLQTDAEARSLGEHIVLVRGTPQDRITALRVPLHAYTGAQQAAILDLDIGYRITVNRTPQGVGSAISHDLIIEGIRHEIDLFEHWIEFNVSVAPDTTNFFIWGTSTWGQSTTWGW